MSGHEEYRALLQAKVDAMQGKEQEKHMLLDDTSLKQNLPTPSPEFIQAHVGNEPPMTEAEVKMKAWQVLEQERSTSIEQPSNETVWQTEKINTEFNREGEEQKKEAQRQRDQDIADNKIRQIEADKEKQRLGNEQEQQRKQAEIQRQAAERTQAERDKQQAQVNLAEQKRSTPDNDYSRNRAMFEQAAERSQSVDREIE